MSSSDLAQKVSLSAGTSPSLTEAPGDAGVASIQLCRKVIKKATGLLRHSESLQDESKEEFPHGTMQQTLEALVVSLHELSGSSGMTDFQLIASEILTNVCVPYLKVLSSEFTTANQQVVPGDLITPLGKLTVSVLRECTTVLRYEMAKLVVMPMVTTLCGHTSGNDGSKLQATSISQVESDNHIVVAFLDQVFQLIGVEELEEDTSSVSTLSTLYTSLLGVLRRYDSATCFLLASCLLPRFATVTHLERVEAIWLLIQTVVSGETTVEFSANDLVLTLLCCFSDVLIGFDKSSPFSSSFSSTVLEASPIVDVRMSGLFWSIVQEGLTSPDPLSRKRCVYLIHRVLKSVQETSVAVAAPQGVFWWEQQSAKELDAVWGDLVLLLETMEEKQVHIVKPVQSRLKSIILATKKCIDGHSLLHVSWLIIAFSRIFVHRENKSVVRWGFQELLEMPFTSSPLLNEEHWKFIFGPVMEGFNECLLFSREPGAPQGVAPSTSKSLNHFLQRFVSELPVEFKGSFLCQFIKACASTKLRELPLVYVTYGLSQLPPQPLLGSEALAAIRTVVQTCILTHKTKLRATVQCFLLTTVCNLTNYATVSYRDVVSTLGSFKASECLTFGSPAWKEACEWVVQLCAKQAVDDSRAAEPLSLFDYLQTSVQICLKQGGEGSEPESILSPAFLARFILLSIDAEVQTSTALLSNEQRSLEDSIALLLSPVVDVISSARTHVYMSESVGHNAVELLVSVLSLFLGGAALTRSALWEGRMSPTGALLSTFLKPWVPALMLYFQWELLVGVKSGDVPNLDDTLFYRHAVDQLYQFVHLFGYASHGYHDIGLTHMVEEATEMLLAHCTKQEIELSSKFLGAVSALAWVCTLLEGNLPNQGTVGMDLERCGSYIVACISKLPANLTIIKSAVGDASQQGSSLARDDNTSSTRERFDWSALVTQCFKSYWQCILYTLRKLYPDTPVFAVSPRITPTAPPPACVGGASQESAPPAVAVNCSNVAALAQVCLDKLDIAGEDIATVLECFSLLVPKLATLDAQTSLIEGVDTMWPLVLEQRENHKPFIRALRAFVSVAFHPALLCVSATEPPVWDLQQKYSQEFSALGEVRTGVYNLLVNHLCSVWLSSSKSHPSATLSSMQAHKGIILQACLFGPIYKRSLRPVEDVEHFIESLGDACSSNCLEFRYLEDDVSVRVSMLTLLVQLTGSADGGGHEGFLQHFLPSFIRSILESLANMSSEKPKYYMNTFTHRVKLRLCQALILLVRQADKGTSCLVASLLLQALQSDNQPSVRYLMEWTLTLVVTTYPELIRSLLYPSLQVTENRASRMCSLLTVAVHVGRSMKSAQEKTAYYLDVFPAVYQWTTCYHFIARVYAQRVVTMMWEEFISCGLQEVLEEFNLFAGCVCFMKDNCDAAKSTQKMNENIFLSLVDTEADLNLETIFLILPQLCGMIDEEWIPASKFVEHSPLWRQDQQLVRVYCNNAQLLVAVRQAVNVGTGATELERPITQQLGSGGKNPSTNTSSAPESQGNVQKKITPWSNAAGAASELFPKVPISVVRGPGRGHRGHTPSKGLVLVASLLHKVPNIGGLCRTCEIFGVSELVVGNIKLLEEKEFQSLSVTAEKWITVTEVKLAALKEYLFVMRKSGYTLVGVEQTAQSKCVTQYSFHRNTVLVLGNEREGIPVEIIHLLDTCVEIPQFGVIRSLNVHVSGAVLVWEYTKQHCLPNNH